MTHEKNHFRVFAVFLTVMVLVSFQHAFTQESAEEIYQAALFKKNADGDVEGAIELFNKILKEFPDNRKICAQAHLQLGMCYEKLGMERAQKSYQQVIEGYPEQIDAVRAAREKLSILLSNKKAGEKVDEGFQINLVGQGLDSLGEISPDNKYLSCVDWETTNLAVIDMESREKIQLTSHERTKSDSPDAYEAPDASIWAPDSKRIAYNWYSTQLLNGQYILICDLRMIRIDDRKSRILYKGDYWVTPYDWSPDGKTILTGFLSEEDWKLGLLSIDDSSTHHLVTTPLTTPSMDYLAYYSRFSPDGKFIAYNHPQEKDSNKSDISLISTDGKQEIPLVQHPADDRLMGFSPDGSWILFISDRTGTLDAWIMPVSEGKPQGDPQLIKREIGLINPMGISRKGSFYYSTPGFNTDIFYTSIDPITGKIIDPPKKYPLSYEGLNKYPDLSLDGKNFVYVSDRGQRTLCIYSLESGEEREISLKGRFRGFGYPRWASDGQSILLMGEDIERGEGFYLVDIQTGENSLIIPHPAWSPVASPDGKTVCYIKETSKEFFQIMKKDIETGEEQELYRIPPYDNSTMALSPDGRRLALMMRENEATRALKVLPVEGGKPVALHSFEKDRQVKYIDITWSPDGRYIYFSKQKPKGDGLWELWRIPSEGGEAQNLKLAMHRFRQLNIHPDGSRITFASSTMHEDVGAVWVMENFLPQKK